MNSYQTQLVNQIFSKTGLLNKAKSEGIRAQFKNPRDELLNICNLCGTCYGMARKMNATQCREVLNEIDCKLQTLLMPRITATEINKQSRDGLWAFKKYGSRVVETFNMDSAKLEELAKRQNEKNAQNALMYGGLHRSAQCPPDGPMNYNPCLEIVGKTAHTVLVDDIAYATLYATKNRNQFNNQETKMITETKHFIHGADVENITEGQLVDLHNDTKKKVEGCESRIKDLQARIIVEKEKMVSYKDAVKVIAEHIKDKRNS